MNKSIIILTILIGTFCYGQNLTIYTSGNPPFQIVEQGGKIIGGANIEFFKELQKRVGDKSEIKGVPWARGYLEIQNNPNTILFSMARTPERESLFKWVGHLSRSRYTLVSKKSNKIVLNSLDDAKKLKKIGAVIADAKEQFMLKEGFTNLLSVSGSDQCIKMLVLDRVDAFTSSDMTFEEKIEDAGFSPDDFEEVLTLKESFSYIAFSKQTSDEVVAKWDKAFQGMIKDGTYEKIYKKPYPKKKK